MERSLPHFKVAQLLGPDRRSSGGDGGSSVRRVGQRRGDAGEEGWLQGIAQVLFPLSDAAATVDDSGIVVAWNAAAERLFGWPASEAVGRSIDELLPAGYPIGEQAGGLQAIAESGRWEGEVIHRLRDGRLLRTEATLTLLRMHAEALAGAVLTFRVPTGRRPLEPAGDEPLAGSPWRTLVENHPEPIGILEHRRIVHANPACATLLGADDAASLRGWSVFDFFSAEQAVVVERTMALVEGGRSLPTIEHRIVRLDGAERVVRSRAVPLHIDGRSVVEVVLNDITEQKKAENALIRSEQRFQAVFDRAGIGMAIADRNTRIIVANPALQQILGFTGNELAGRYCRALTHPDDLSIFNHFIEQLVRGELDRFHMEKRVLRKDGSYAWGSVVATAIHREDDQIEYLIFMVEDITTRKRTEEELIAAQGKAEEMTLLKSSFLTNMSHEIRTPLTGIIGFASILAEEVSGEHRELIAMIEHSGHRLLQTLNAILDLSMLESGTLKVKPMELNIVEEVQALTSQLAIAVREKGLSFSFIGDARELRAIVDRTSLDRIVTNLVQNAIKFTQKGGIRVVVQSVGDWVEIQVIDTGIGIDEAFMPYLFDAFRQESTGMARSYEGNGLGLTITKRLVEYMGGEMAVESTSGSGSTFTVWLPMMSAAGAVPKAPTEGLRFRPGGARSRRPRVLVLEDNRDARMLLQRFLSDRYEVSLTSREDQALDAAQRERFDVVLMDINLGGNRTGVDALRALRHLTHYEQVPVVALTAYAISGDRERFLSQGFDGYLGKPLTRKELHQVIADVLTAPNRS